MAGLDHLNEKSAGPRSDARARPGALPAEAIAALADRAWPGRAGRKGLPLTQLYRQMFNNNLYLLAYGSVYSNDGAMTPGASGGTANGMSEAEIGEIIGLMRFERYGSRRSAGHVS